MLTGALAGATVFSLASKAQPGPGGSLALGFIGSGIRGSQLIDEFKEVPGTRGIIVADLYDGCLERAKEQLGPSTLTTKEYRRVLDNKDVEAVVIATPDHWHEKIVHDALSAGKHVYIEKPMTWSYAEGERIVAASKQRPKQVLQVGSQGKSSTLAAKAKEIVASGQLGQITMVRMADHRNSAEGAWVYPIPPDANEKTVDWKTFLGTRPQRPFDPKVFYRWRCWWEFSGGVATDLFVHQFTTLHEIMGVKHPSAAISGGGLYRWKDGRNVPDVLNSIVEYDGWIADTYVTLNSSQGRGRGFTILGTKASLVIESRKVTLMPEPVFPEVQNYGSSNWPKRLRDAYLGGHENDRAQTKPVQEIPVEEGLSHAGHFVQSVTQNKPSVENAEEGHYAASAAFLANLSYRQKKRAQWSDLAQWSPALTD